MFAAVFKRQLARNLVKLDNETSCYGLETNDQIGVEDAASTCIWCNSTGAFLKAVFLKQAWMFPDGSVEYISGIHQIFRTAS